MVSFLVFGGYSAHAQGNLEPKGFYPADGQFGDWKLMDSVRMFKPATLYLQVGEDAGLYEECGIRQSFEGVYTDSAGTRMDLEIFEMSDTGGAWSIFSQNSSSKGKEIELADAAMLFDYHIHFVKGNFYVRCSTTSREKQYRNEVIGLGEFISTRISGHAKIPGILMAFNFEDIVASEEKYFRGQIGLNRIFDFGHGSIAGFREGASCRAGEKFFIVLSYQDERSRREWFASARGKVKMPQNIRFTDYRMEDDGFTAKDKSGVLFAFKPYKNYILIVSGYSWTEGNRIFQSMGRNLDQTLY